MVGENSGRKTATILAAEVVRRGDQTGDPGSRRKILEGWVTTHKGRVLSTTNTAVLAEMPSAAAAVDCANDIQDEIGGALAHGGAIASALPPGQ